VTISNGTDIEAQQWRDMARRVFGEDMTPSAAEARIMKLQKAACPGYVRQGLPERNNLAGSDRTR
jgi:hypothetical protein